MTGSKSTLCNSMMSFDVVGGHYDTVSLLSFAAMGVHCVVSSTGHKSRSKHECIVTRAMA